MVARSEDANIAVFSAPGRHFPENSSSFLKASQRQRAVGILREAITLPNELNRFLDLVHKGACDFGSTMRRARDVHINKAGMCEDPRAGTCLPSARAPTRPPP